MNQTISSMKLKMFRKSMRLFLTILVLSLSYFFYVSTLFGRIIYKIQNTQLLSVSTQTQGNSRSRSNIQKRDFVTSNNRNIFIFGATGINSTKEAAWDKFNVYGQRYDISEKLLCCLKYPDGKLSELPIEYDHEHYTTWDIALPLFNVICGNPRSEVLPEAVSIMYNGNSCNSSNISYIEPYFSLRQANNTFAITTKVAYGNPNPDLLIAWMEAYLWLGVDKVITYALNNLSSDARAVIEYYARRNVLDLYEYQLPESEVIPRDFQWPWYQIFADAAVPMFDAFARSSGYTYFSVQDWDEFIIPSGNRTLKQFLGESFAKNSRAAGFDFQTQFFITSARPEESDVYLKKCVHRINSPSKIDRAKIIFKPELARLASTHTIDPIPGYELLHCKPSDARIRHFRDCFPKDENLKICLKAPELDLVKDMEASKWSDNIDDNIRRAKAAIFPYKLK